MCWYDVGTVLVPGSYWVGIGLVLGLYYVGIKLEPPGQNDGNGDGSNGRNSPEHPGITYAVIAADIDAPSPNLY